MKDVKKVIKEIREAIGNIQSDLEGVDLKTFERKCNTVLVNAEAIKANRWDNLSESVREQYEEVYNIWMQVGGMQTKKEIMDSFGGYIPEDKYEEYTDILVDELVKWIKSYN